MKYAYKKYGNETSSTMVAYLWEEMWWLHAFELGYNEAQGPFYYWTIRANPKQPKP